MNRYQDTIAALSTPPGESGIAVVRMSGSDALAILGGVFRAAPAAAGQKEWEHRRVYVGKLVEPGGDIVDEVMCTVMRAPNTYTGEDLVELSCHGGTLVVRRVLDVLHGQGAAFAQPGEFTKRAFLNGKMDLIQAEAVADLIHARSDLQRKVAHEQLSGGLSSRINDLADQVL
jgi:tRNA modification GTPase